MHGEGTDKYDAVRIGITGRLDTIQAAVLLEKLKIFPEEIAARNAWRSATPTALPTSRRCRASATNRPRSGRNTPSGLRRAGAMRFAAALKAQGIPTAIYYAKPLNRQAAYRGFPVAEGGVPVSERLAEEVISLPMHAYLERAGPGPHHRGGLPGAGGIAAISAYSRVSGNPDEACIVAVDCWVARFRGDQRSMVTRRAMIERIFTVGGYTLLSRLTGFLRDIMLAAILGAGPVADAFFVAFRLPNHFRAIFAEGAFNAAFIPAYARIRTQSGPHRRSLFGDRIFTLLIATQVVLLALALLFTPQVIDLLAPGFSRDPQQFRAGGLADADHVPLSAAHHAGDAVGRHPQRAASFCGSGGGADPAQSGDDGDAGLVAVSSAAPATPRPGAC